MHSPEGTSNCLSLYVAAGVLRVISFAMLSGSQFTCGFAPVFERTCVLFLNNIALFAPRYELKEAVGHRLGWHKPTTRALAEGLGGQSRYFLGLSSVRL